MAKAQISINLDMADIIILDDVCRQYHCKNRTEAVETIIHQWKSFLNSTAKQMQIMQEEAKLKHRTHGKQKINPMVNP